MKTLKKVEIWKPFFKIDKYNVNFTDNGYQWLLGLNNKPLKDDSIVAQVFVKCAVELAKEKDFDNNDALGEYLCMAVSELNGAYKLAVNLLENN